MDYVSQEDLFYYYYQKYFNKNNDKNEYDFIIEEIQKIENAEKEYKYLCSLDEKAIFEKIKKEDYRSFKNEDFNQLSTEVIKNVIRSFLKQKYEQLRNVSVINKNYLQYKLKHFQSIYKVKVDEIQDDNEVKNQHNQIFSYNGFELFRYILENYIADKGKRGRYADISFYYWKLYNNTPQYIHQRPEVFKNWFCNLYSDSFEKIKTLKEVTDQKRNREKHYTTSLDWFKNKT